MKSDVPAPIAASATPLSGKARDHRRVAGQEKERRDREDRAAGEQEEGREGRGPGRAAEFLRVDAELLADQRVERGLLVAQQPVGERAWPAASVRPFA